MPDISQGEAAPELSVSPIESEEVTLADLPAPPRAEAEPHLSNLPRPPTSKRASSNADLPPPSEASRRPEPAAPTELYGDPKGWSDRPARPSWATEFMAALNAMDFPETAGEPVDVQFTLRVCKDGSLVPRLIGGEGLASVHAELMKQLAATTVPAPSPSVQAKMKSDCAKLDHVFRWTGAEIR